MAVVAVAKLTGCATLRTLLHTLWDAERMTNFKGWLQMAVHLMGVNGALAHWNRGKVKTLFYHNVLPNTAAFPDALPQPKGHARGDFLIPARLGTPRPCSCPLSSSRCCGHGI